MVIAVAGYIGTMLAAFMVLVTMWHHVIGGRQFETVRQQPQRIGAVRQAAPAMPEPGRWGPAVVHKADEGSDAAASAQVDAQLAAAKAAAAEKARRLRLAREQRRKEELARQRDDQQYSPTLGYQQEQPQSFAQPFSPFGPRRF
jgi:hypothetical protein